MGSNNREIMREAFERWKHISPSDRRGEYYSHGWMNELWAAWQRAWELSLQTYFELEEASNV